MGELDGLKPFDDNEVQKGLTYQKCIYQTACQASPTLSKWTKNISVNLGSDMALFGTPS